ncbi:TPR repeat-containing protein YrrB [Maioricimonas rarisocia]|uniref:TPR repeat-containing protein YrrB n=1 Tax=Maioricimonas rarisocia TaxID=2528026 RepID=A0A517Z9Y7_9PLAN|nr:tetratricopeptide repeat protein [Maioricimonas rarisocia]QDU39293.1 TPR repeat-containing protein YrrB [Maioricimonas rarisocia]
MSGATIEAEGQTAGPREAASHGRLAAWAPWLIVAAAVACYANSFEGTFVFDDENVIVINPTVRQLWSIPQRSNRPLTEWTFGVNYAISGLQTWSWHLVNLLIHAAAGMTLYGIVRRTLQRATVPADIRTAATGLALTTALVWTVHPLQTQAVTYIVQRMESLMGLFYLLTLYCFIRSDGSSRTRRWLLLSVVCCFLGMQSKPVMITAPFVMLLYDRIFVATTWKELLRRRWGYHLALWAVSVTTVAWSARYATAAISKGVESGAAERITSTSYLFTQAEVLLWYLRLSVWPAGQCIDYGWPFRERLSEVLLPGLVIVALLLATLWCLLRRSPWGFVGAWFFVILAPTSSFVAIRDAAFEHRMYLPLASVVLAVVVGGYRLIVWGSGRQQVAYGTRRTLQWAAVSLVVLLLGTVTILRNGVYASDRLLWEDVIAKAPQNPRGYNNLGRVYELAGNAEQALVLYEEALARNPHPPMSVFVYHNRARVLIELGRIEEALADIETAIEESDGKLSISYMLRGIGYRRQGRLDEAMSEFDRSIELNPDFADTWNNRGLVRLMQNDLDAAEADFDRAIELRPDLAEPYANRGVVHRRRNQLGKAIADYTRALKRDPRHLDARYNRGLALAAAGRAGDALADFTAILKQDPGNTDAWRERAFTYAGAGDVRRCLADLQRYEELGGRLSPEAAAAVKQMVSRAAAANRRP